MASLVTRDLRDQEHAGRMMQLEKDYPEIPREIIDNTLIKMNGDVFRAKQELDQLSEKYLFGAGEGIVSPVHTPSPQSPQSPIRFPLLPGSPSRSRTPSNPSTPGTPPMMDPFAGGRSSPSRTQMQYQQHKPGQYNASNSPQHYVSQLHVAVGDRPSSRPSSRPPSGSNQDEQLINGTNSASSSTTSGTPNRTPSGTPTRDMPRPPFASQTSSQSSTYDDFPKEFNLTPIQTGAVERRPMERLPSSERLFHVERSNAQGGGRSTPPPSHQRRYTPPHRTYDDRHPMDVQVVDYYRTNTGEYPVRRWNESEYAPQPRPMSHGGHYDPRDSRVAYHYPPIHQYPQQQHYPPTSNLHYSQSVPNLQEQLSYQPHLPRDHPANQPQMVQATSNREISFFNPNIHHHPHPYPHHPHPHHPHLMTPAADIRTPEVVMSTHVVHPEPHSPPMLVSRPPRPHSESYDPRLSDPFLKGTTTSLLVLPGDSRTRSKSTKDQTSDGLMDAWMEETTPTSENQKYFTLQHPKPKHADDEYTQALIRHQNARFQKLLQDLENERLKLEQYRQEVHTMEADLEHKSIRKSPFPTAEAVNLLRQEKRQLQIDIECMSREIELHKSQGLVSQSQHNNFYANMSTTGPSGPIPPKLQDHLYVHPPPSLLPDQPAATTIEPDEGPKWNCNSCTLLNHPALDKCEACEMPRVQ